MTKVTVQVQTTATYRGVDREKTSPENLEAVIREKVTAAIEQAGAEATVVVKGRDG